VLRRAGQGAPVVGQFPIIRLTMHGDGVTKQGVPKSQSQEKQLV
jgi:hypothetical protein